MQEHQIEVSLGIKVEPVENVYRANDFKSLNEINRIIRIFEINNSQNMKHKVFALEMLSSLKALASIN